MLRADSLEPVIRYRLSLTLFAVLFGLTSSSFADPQIVINEFLANNGRTNLDEEGDSSDWVELLNTSNEDVNMLGWALSDDAAEPRKWMFPEVVIPAGGYLLVWCSGKDRVGIAPEIDAGDLATMVFRPVFIEREASWRYLIAAPGTPGPPAGWNTIGFDDGAFQVGRSGFGYGDGDDFTEVPENTNAVFIRREFEILSPAHVTNLVLQIDYDDAFVAYLNGVRVASVNAPASDPDFDVNGTAKHEAGTAERFNLTPYLAELVPGSNVLAIAAINTLDPGSSDMSCHPELGIVPDILHANFSLEDAGEVILLTGPGREEVDGVEYPQQTQDHSYGHAPNGTGPWRYLLTPTPELPNETLSFTEPISTFVDVSPEPRRRSGQLVSVTMTAEPAGLMSIYYTTDGREPTVRDSRYNSALSITENTVVRVAGFIDGERATQVVSKSYFLGRSHSNQDIELPVLSISMDPSDYRWIQENTGARGRGAERVGYWEYFDRDGRLVASTGFGLRLHGGAGRGGGFNTKKAYKAYFRGSYGDSKLRYPLIEETPVDEFDKLVLRSNFNDSFRTNGRATYLRDELIRDLHKDMGALVSHGTWCHLYVNMQYRGIYNVVERMDEEFLESHLGFDDWDVIKTGNDVLVGTSDEWNRLRSFIVNNDMSDEALYRQALSMIDIGNYTSYMLVNIWAQNHDWPHNNWYAARPRTPDGKWIFLSWDAEFGIGLSPSGWSTNTFDFVLSRGGYLRDILDGLIDSPIYRRYFKEEAFRHASGALFPSRALVRINLLESVVAPDMDDECALMGRSRATWNDNVGGMEQFAQNRTPVFRDFIERSSRLAGPVDMTPILLDVSPSEVVATPATNVTLIGQNLVPDLEVWFNSRRGTVVSWIGSRRLVVRVPFHLDVIGEISIDLHNQAAGLRVVEPGFLTILPPTPIITSITPAEGDARGGEEVEISGQFFLEGVEVWFGNTRSPSVVRQGDDMRTIVAVTPEGVDTVLVQVVNTQPGRYPSESRLPFTFQRTGFRRGDVNESGQVDLSDAVALLAYLFQGADEPTCFAVLDVDRTGFTDLTDAIVLLGHLFLGAEAPPAPFPACGRDPLGDLLPCESFAGCD